jgi:hypothetical protein
MEVLNVSHVALSETKREVLVAEGNVRNNHFGASLHGQRGARLKTKGPRSNCC